MLPDDYIFSGIRATFANYKYTLNIKVWQLIFYVKTGKTPTVSKPYSSCIENEL